jgi:hypothetical protein
MKKRKVSFRNKWWIKLELNSLRNGWSWRHKSLYAYTLSHLSWRLSYSYISIICASLTSYSNVTIKRNMLLLMLLTKSRRQHHAVSSTQGSALWNSGANLRFALSLFRSFFPMFLGAECRAVFINLFDRIKHDNSVLCRGIKWQELLDIPAHATSLNIIPLPNLSPLALPGHSPSLNLFSSPPPLLNLL